MNKLTENFTFIENVSVHWFCFGHEVSIFSYNVISIHLWCVRSARVRTFICVWVSNLYEWYESIFTTILTTRLRLCCRFDRAVTYYHNHYHHHHHSRKKRRTVSMGVWYTTVVVKKRALHIVNAKRGTTSTEFFHRIRILIVCKFQCKCLIWYCSIELNQIMCKSIRYGTYETPSKA